MPKPQSAQSHASNDHVWGAATLILLVNFVLSIYYTIREWPIHSRSHLWWIVMSIAFILMHQRIRGYATRNQDRIIRLEERIRYAAVLSGPDLQRAAALSLKQVIALRFASDAELPALMNRALRENLTPKQIKESITDWQPDHHRV